MTPSRRWIEAILTRIQGDFLDTPALRLTLLDAQRRFDLDDATCEALFGTLVDAQVLTRWPDGTYLRYFPRPVAVPTAPVATTAEGRIRPVAEHAA